MQGPLLSARRHAGEDWTKEVALLAALALKADAARSAVHNTRRGVLGGVRDYHVRMSAPQKDALFVWRGPFRWNFRGV